MTVHAHPDDESSKGASTVARYRSEGVDTALVCCTGGEAGDVLNPALDTANVRDNLAAVRRAELERAVAIIGYNHLFWLGYRDSGMAITTPTRNRSRRRRSTKRSAGSWPSSGGSGPTSS